MKKVNCRNKITSNNSRTLRNIAYDDIALSSVSNQIYLRNTKKS